jgi:hypothetical protein
MGRIPRVPTRPSAWTQKRQEGREVDGPEEPKEHVPHPFVRLADGGRGRLAHEGDDPTRSRARGGVMLGA